MNRPTTTSRRQKLFFTTTALILVLFLVEGCSSFVVSARTAMRIADIGELSYCIHDAELGWCIEPGRRIENLFGPGRHFTSNARGFRSTVEYTAETPPERYRIVFAGDSFTEGFGVRDDQTFPAHVEALEPTIQAINMGVGGYGIDQAYLRYCRDGRELEHHMLVLSFIASDFDRMTRDEFLRIPKPMLALQGDRVVAENVPIPQPWLSSTAHRRLDAFVAGLGFGRITRGLSERAGFLPARSIDWRPLARAVFDDLRRMTTESGRWLVLVYLPLRRLLSEEPTPECTFVSEYAAENGVTFLDLTDVAAPLATRELDRFFLADTHYSPHGNRLVAKEIVRRLRELDPTFPR